MGRPLHKKYFGNTGPGDLGGEAVASFAAGVAGSYAGNAQPTFTVAAPSLPGGVTATGTTVMGALSAVATVPGNGYDVGDILTVTYNGGTATFTVATLTGGAGSGVATVTVLSAGTFATTTTGAKATTNNGGGDDACTLTITYKVVGGTVTLAGSGYTSVPAVTMSAGTGTLTAVLTSSVNAISTSAFIPAANGGSSAVAGDFVKQVNTRSYKVTTAQGTGICKLVAAAPTAGQMTIAATDANGSTYYVTKLTARKATLTQNVVNGSFLFATGATVQWGFAAAAGSVVQIANA